MSDNNSSKRIINPNKSISPSSPINQGIVSSHHPHVIDNIHRSSWRSSDGSSSSHSRARQISNRRSSIQMEPNLQALLIAEGQAAEMITTARAKRLELLRQAKLESEAEIEAFRSKRDTQYKIKLHEATQLEKFQAKLDQNKVQLLEQMKTNVKNERQSLVNYIIHHIIDQIPVKPHPNTKRIVF